MNFALLFIIGLWIVMLVFSPRGNGTAQALALAAMFVCFVAMGLNLKRDRHRR